MQVAWPKPHARQPLFQRLDTLFRIAAEVLDARESLFFVIGEEPHAVALGDFDERGAAVMARDPQSGKIGRFPAGELGTQRFHPLARNGLSGSCT